MRVRLMVLLCSEEFITDNNFTLEKMLHTLIFLYLLEQKTRVRDHIFSSVLLLCISIISERLSQVREDNSNISFSKHKPKSVACVSF